MRLALLIMVGVLILVLVVPFITLYVTTVLRSQKTALMEETPIPIKVYSTSGNQLIQMDLENYLEGVVAAEMPAHFSLEALKAQAVTARTYVYKRLQLYGGQGCSQHAGADVCTDHTCCQAYASTEQLLQRWGHIDHKLNMAKIHRAVTETKGKIITYQGITIDPLYHSTCGGQTENSEAVWGAALPYLRSVPCPYGMESPRLHDTVVISQAAMALKLSQLVGGVPAFAVEPSIRSMAVSQRTDTGRVSVLKVGNVEYRGTDIRQALGLRSTNFSWAFDGDNVVFTTMGYGHGVGMCQYGAQGMALQGYTYTQIIRHYYQGVEIEDISHFQ